MWIFTWVFDWGRCPHSGVHHGVLARKCYVADGPKGDREIDWMFWTGCAMPVIFLFALGVHGLPLVGPGISRPGPGFVEDIPRTQGFLDTQLRWSYCLLLFSSNYLAVGVSPSKRLVCFFSVSAQPRKAQLCGLEMETSYVWSLVQILMVYWLFRRTGLPTWSDRWMTSWGSATLQPQRCGFLEGSHICLSQPGRPKQAHLALRSLCHYRFGMPSTALW